MKPRPSDHRRKLRISGDELRELKRHVGMMAEAFGLDRKIDNYAGIRPLTLYRWDLDCLIDVIAWHSMNTLTNLRRISKCWRSSASVCGENTKAFTASDCEPRGRKLFRLSHRVGRLWRHWSGGWHNDLPSDDSDISRCQVCGRPAQVHLTEVRGKRKSQKHLPYGPAVTTSHSSKASTRKTTTASSTSSSKNTTTATWASAPSACASLRRTDARRNRLLPRTPKLDRINVLVTPQNRLANVQDCTSACPRFDTNVPRAIRGRI
jgi:hypothetical protein